MNQNKDKRYNNSFDTQIAIWSVLAEYATKDNPMSVTDICKALEKKREEYGNGYNSEGEAVKRSVSKSTMGRYLPGAAKAINSLSRSAALMEKGATNAKFAYFEAGKLHVVLEREGDEDDKLLRDGEMAVIFELREPIEARATTIANLLNKYPPDEDTLYGTGVTPLRLKCVMAQNSKTGKRKYVPYQTLADDDDERAKREENTPADSENKVDERRNNRPRYYYLESILSPAEWRIFADLVKVYPYITKRQTKKFLSALAQMNPGYGRKDGFAFNERYAFKRESSSGFFKIIDTLDTAIREHRPVAVKYGQYELEQQDNEWVPVLRERLNKYSSGGVWLMKPYALMWSNGYYYLVGKTEGYGEGYEMMNLRVDRILNATIIMDDTQIFRTDPAFDPYEYRDKSPVMYPGKPEPVRLRCKVDMVNVLLDFFGAQARFGEPKDGYTTVLLNIAPKGVKLFAMQYADRVEVLEPKTLRDEVRSTLQAALQGYQNQ